MWQQIFEGYGQAGSVVTAGGLVFVGTGSNVAGYFFAFDAKTGELLWKFNTGAGVFSSPSVYMVNGEEFVTVGVRRRRARPAGRRSDSELRAAETVARVVHRSDRASVSEHGGVDECGECFARPGRSLLQRRHPAVFFGQDVEHFRGERGGEGVMRPGALDRPFRSIDLPGDDRNRVLRAGAHLVGGDQQCAYGLDELTSDVRHRSARRSSCTG